MLDQNPNILIIALDLNGQNTQIRRQKPFILYVAVSDIAIFHLDTWFLQVILFFSPCICLFSRDAFPLAMDFVLECSICPYCVPMASTP